MIKVIHAIYKDGVFKPLQKVNIKSNQKFELIIFPSEEAIPELVKAQKKALSKLCGIGESGLADLSRRHDKYLYRRGQQPL